METVWVDVTRCTGCGACVEICPVDAITLVDGRACVSEEVCTGCGDCVDVCPEDAIQPMIRGELIPVAERPAPTVYRSSQPLAKLRTPAVETAAATVVVAGTSLLMRAARALTRAIGRWLTRWLEGTRPFRRQGQNASAGTTLRAEGRSGRGYQARHRRRRGERQSYG